MLVMQDRYWLQSGFSCKEGSIEFLLLSAAEAGHVGLLQWAQSNGILAEDNLQLQYAYYAAQTNQVEVLAWMLAAGHLIPVSSPVASPYGVYLSMYTNPAAGAAEGGHVRVLKWLKAHGLFRNGHVLESAASDSHFEVLEWALSNGCEWDQSICCSAAKRGNTAVVDWAAAQGCRCAAHSSA
eukprot:TRINITY_DN571_c0_g1_i6.p1 TRINITY_DN571_c0_g1~~TRINITY_DN571_c0_g1_i6.p1  ORF type:complete len:182 (-),score=24.17 TRINITY_DN571_c0_g1_i6:648-1193(-)